MNALTLQQRADAYHTATGYPTSLFVGGDGRLVGTWIMGNNYRVKSTYYGGYPAGYLRRIKALFPDKKNVLHLFSGMVDATALPGRRVDLNPDLAPDWVDDAEAEECVCSFMAPFQGPEERAVAADALVRAVAAVATDLAGSTRATMRFAAMSGRKAVLPQTRFTGRRP